MTLPLHNVNVPLLSGKTRDLALGVHRGDSRMVIWEQASYQVNLLPIVPWIGPSLELGWGGHRDSIQAGRCGDGTLLCINDVEGRPSTLRFSTFLLFLFQFYQSRSRRGGTSSPVSRNLGSMLEGATTGLLFG